MKEVKIKKSILKMLFAFLILFISGLLLTFIEIIAWEENGWDMRLLGVFLALTMYFFSMFYLKHLVFNKPLVTINEEGFYDNSSMIATGDRLVHWKEVKDISLRYFGGQSYITVALKDPYKTLEHEDLATRMIADYNTQYTEGEINIMLKFVTKYSDEECLMFMQNAFEKYKRKQKLSGKEDKEFAFLENTLD